MNHRSLTFLPLLALCAPVGAQSGGELGLPPAAGLDAALQSWRAEHGDSWRVLVDPSTRHLEMLYGGNALPVFQPDPADDADWFALARHWVAVTEPMHGISEAELVDERSTYLPLGTANGTDKITVRLSQVLHGLPVEGAKVNALFDTAGRLLSLHSTAAPRTENLSSVPVIGGSTALRAAVGAFEREAGVPALEVGDPSLLFAQVDLGLGREARLAWQVSVHNDAEPAGYLYTVDARTGDVLRRDNEIHHFDVKGVIQSFATPGLEADHAGNPPVALPMSHIRLTSSAGTIDSDRDGNFNFVGVNSPLNITVQYLGPFANVNNQAGSDYSITFNNVQPNVNNVLVMNPSPTQQVTAQANSLQHISVLRNYVRDVNPGDSTADFQATANPNISSTCNAFYNGNSVNFYLAGGGCNNTAFTTVVAHEMGHWLNVLYGTGNGSDGMGEGNGDVFAMYVYDDPIVARFFFTGGGSIRTGLNTRQFCGDCCGGCYGEVHNDGEVWMGAAWKVRRNLKTALGDPLGRATADSIFMGWMNAYNQTQIKSIIETQWLTLDDNDGNIDNGTPNYDEIDAGFREQGFPGFDLPFIQFSNVTQLPDVPADSGPYVVNADIVASIVPPITSADLNWRLVGGSWNSVPMTPAGGNTWTGSIPSIGGIGIVEYYLDATDSGANNVTFPKGGMNDPLEFTVGMELEVDFWDFEATGDQGWTVGHPSDTATTGVWVRDDPRGTPAQPEDDHTAPPGVKCWFTGQGPVGGGVGDNDVDNGPTSLLSPVLDLSGLSFVQVSYWRWFSNDQGGNPNSDIFTVLLSFDGGANYQTVETVGPNDDESHGQWFQGGFLVDSFGTPTANMRVRFVAADNGGGSIVEAAIDDVRISYLDGGGCATSKYCNPASGSPNNLATIDISGCQLSGSVLLSLGNGPSGQFTYALIGDGNAKITNPPGAIGDLCVAGGTCLGRYAKDVGTISGGGTFSLDISNTLSGGANFGIPTCGGNIQSGESWNFQFWHRNGMGAPSGFSEAISVTFQ